MGVWDSVLLFTLPGAPVACGAAVGHALPGVCNRVCVALTRRVDLPAYNQQSLATCV